jgi:hypothetical protein
VATRIEQDGSMQRRMVDTAQRNDGPRWEDLAARALAWPPPYRPVRGAALYHISVDDQRVQVGEYDLNGPLRDLVTVVLAMGDAVLARAAPGLVGYGLRLCGLFKILMMVVMPRPLIFWMRGMLSPAAAASRTASSRLPASQCRSFFSAALSRSGERPMQLDTLPSLCRRSATAYPGPVTAPAVPKEDGDSPDDLAGFRQSFRQALLG